MTTAKDQKIEARVEEWRSADLTLDPVWCQSFEIVISPGEKTSKTHLTRTTV